MSPTRRLPLFTLLLFAAALLIATVFACGMAILDPHSTTGSVWGVGLLHAHGNWIISGEIGLLAACMAAVVASDRRLDK